MPISRDESIAGLRLLVCMAKADGVLHDKERAILEATFEDLELPEGIDLQWVLDEPIALATVLGQITTDEAKDASYAAVYALACTDGDCSAEERELLERILKGEEESIDWLESQLHVVEDIGRERYLAEQLG